MSQISPGLYLQEINYPQFQQALGTTILCILGGATKGPVNKPTPIGSVNQLTQIFGYPVTTDSGLQTAIQYLSGGNQLVYTRVAHTDVSVAGTTVGVITGNSAAVKATGYIQFTSNGNPADQDFITISNGVTVFTFEFDNNQALYSNTHVAVPIGLTAAQTMANLVNAINSTTAAVATLVPSASGLIKCTLVATTAGTVGNVAILQGTNSVSTGYASTTVINGMANGSAAVAGTTTNNALDLFAASPGSWGNNVQVTITVPSVVVGAPAGNFDVSIAVPSGLNSATNVTVETFTNLSLTSTSARFIDTVLANGIGGQFAASQYITTTTVTAGIPVAGTYTLGTVSGGGTATVGTDGITNLVAADYIGTVNGNQATGILACRNTETVHYNLLCIPGVSNYSVIQAGIANALFRQDHLFLVDPPIGLNAAQAIAWINGQQPSGVANPPTVALDSVWASCSWPWKQVYDPYNATNIWVPPSTSTAQIMAFSDGQGGPWLPAAGPNRGVTNGIQLETSPDQPTRDLLYAANINPFASLPEGIERYGNITLSRNVTLLQGEAARRAVIYAVQAVAGVIRYQVLQPNNAITQKNTTILANQALSSIMSGNGLAAAYVTCDSSNNPAGGKTLTVDLFLEPVDIAEKVLLRFTGAPNGTVFTGNLTQ